MKAVGTPFAGWCQTMVSSVAKCINSQSRYSFCLLYYVLVVLVKKMFETG